MEPAAPSHAAPPVAEISDKRYRIASRSLLFLSILLVAAVLVANLRSPAMMVTVLVSLLLAGIALVLVSAGVLWQVRRSEDQARTVFEKGEQDFQQMADSIQEIFWVADARTMRLTFVNAAFEAITGRSRQSLLDGPSLWEDLVFPDDRIRLLTSFQTAARTGSFDEQFRIVKPDGEVRWVWVRGFPHRDRHGFLTRFGGTALDVTALKRAEDQVAANLAMATSACSEAEALRKATLALTGDLHMDCVLDALLGSLAELVPYACARVLAPESGGGAGSSCGKNLRTRTPNFRKRH